MVSTGNQLVVVGGLMCGFYGLERLPEYGVYFMTRLGIIGIDIVGDDATGPTTTKVTKITVVLS